MGEPGSKELFDAEEIIGIFKDPFGREAPTTRGIIHYSSSGAHIVPAAPNGWKRASGPALLEYLKASARRALQRQTPDGLYAFSVGLDEDNSLFSIKAHFVAEPSENDLEDISVVATEMVADLPEFDFGWDLEVVPAEAISPLSGGCAFTRTAE